VFCGSGVSNAGVHEIGFRRQCRAVEGFTRQGTSIPWTVDEFITSARIWTIVHEFSIKETVGLSRAPSRHVHFVSHSIGVHFTTTFYILRPACKRTRVNLMLYSMKAPRSNSSFSTLCCRQSRTDYSLKRRTARHQ
jgi:hypothetical protein